MKNLKLNKGLTREEMRTITGGQVMIGNDPACTCGTKKPVLTHCDCQAFCDGTCTND
jgi:hypothetical protein